MAELSSSDRATQSGGLQQVRVGPKVGTLYVDSASLFNASDFNKKQ